MSPATRTPGNPGRFGEDRGELAGRVPALLSSPPRLTSIRTGTAFPDSAAQREISSSRWAESAVWIQENRATALRTLFPCRRPIMCHSASGSPGIFSSASWT